MDRDYINRASGVSKPRITADELRARVHYDPQTGAFTWRTSHFKRFVGKPAGTIWRRKKQAGYQLRFDGVSYRAHIIAWLYMTGEWPSAIVDHKDCDGRNNRWINLRLATDAQSNANRRRQENSTGFKGVSRMGRSFKAGIMVNKKGIHLGTFKTPQQAHAAYAAAAQKYFGEFARAE